MAAQAYCAAPLLRYPVMTNQVITAFQNILLIRCLKRVIVMNYIWHAVLISPVGDDADMIPENYNVSPLPLLNILQIGGKGDGVVLEIDKEIPDTAEINILVRRVHLIIFRMLTDICINELAQVVAGCFHSVCDDIRTDAVPVIRVAGAVVFAFIFGMRSHIVQRALQNVRLIVQAVPILIDAAMKLRNLAGILTGWSSRRRMLVS